MASIQKVFSKRTGEHTGYRLRCCLGRDNDGRQVFETCTISKPEGLTPKKEEKEIMRLSLEWEKKVHDVYNSSKCIRKAVDKNKITYSDFVNGHWFPDCIDNGSLSRNTVESYRYTARYSLEYFGSRKRLSSIDAEEVKRFVNYMRNEHMQNGHCYSDTTIRAGYTTLNTILNYAKRMQYIPINPCDYLTQRDKPKKKKQSISFLTAEQAVRWQDNLENESLFQKCLCMVLLYTGIRRGECAGLQWGDIDKDNLVLHICRNVTMDPESDTKLHVGPTKTGEDRYVPLDFIYPILEEHKQEQERKYGCSLLPNAYIFCKEGDPYTPVYVTSITRWVTSYSRKNGLNASPHDMRHTAATLATKCGASMKQVQTLLGHADPATTMRYYSGVDKEMEHETVKSIKRAIDNARKE